MAFPSSSLKSSLLLRFQVGGVWLVATEAQVTLMQDLLAEMRKTSSTLAAMK